MEFSQFACWVLPGARDPEGAGHDVGDLAHVRGFRGVLPIKGALMWLAPKPQGPIDAQRGGLGE